MPSFKVEHKMPKLNYKPDLGFPFHDKNDEHNGRQIGAYYRWDDQVLTAAENPVFEATIRLEGISKGRSSIKYNFVDVNTNMKFEMFFSDFIDVLMYHDLKAGVEFTDKFHIENKAGYYGLVAHCGRQIDEN